MSHLHMLPTRNLLPELFSFCLYYDIYACCIIVTSDNTGSNADCHRFYAVGVIIKLKRLSNKIIWRNIRLPERYRCAFGVRSNKATMSWFRRRSNLAKRPSSPCECSPKSQRNSSTAKLSIIWSRCKLHYRTYFLLVFIRYIAFVRLLLVRLINKSFLEKLVTMNDQYRMLSIAQRGIPNG